MLPPSSLAARCTSSRGTSRISRPRPRLGSSHSGEWWWSVTVSWRATDCPASSAPAPEARAGGRGGGRWSRPARWCGRRCRRPAASRGPGCRWSSPTAIRRPTGSGRSSTSSSIGTSRATSMNCSDRRMPPSPSVMVWCIFWMSAARPSGRPSTTHELPERAGAVERVLHEQGGQVEQLAHRPRLGQGQVAHVARRCRSRARRATPAEPADPGPAPPAGAGGGCCETATSIRRRNRSRSGERSSSVTLPKFELRYGSLSTFHSRASRSDMRRSPSSSRGSPGACSLVAVAAAAACPSGHSGCGEPSGRRRGRLSGGCWCA